MEQPNNPNKKSTPQTSNTTSATPESYDAGIARIDVILNKKDGTLPFGYFHPDSDGKLTWNCGLCQKGKRVISVFCYDYGDRKDKQITDLGHIKNPETMKKAVNTRDELIKSHWQPLKPPEITVKYADGSEKPLSRKQKRCLNKKIQKLSKQNPLDDSDEEEV